MCSVTQDTFFSPLYFKIHYQYKENGDFMGHKLLGHKDLQCCSQPSKT